MPSPLVLNMYIPSLEICLLLYGHTSAVCTYAFWYPPITSRTEHGQRVKHNNSYIIYV